MSNGWKKYGGLSNVDKYQHLTIGTLVADQVLLREKVSTVTKFETKIECPILICTADISGANLYATNKLTSEGEAVIKSKLYLGTYGRHYFFSTNNGIGINTDTPSATLDICGNLIVRSPTPFIRNIIAQNNNNRGIAVIVDQNGSYIDFFNTTNMNTDINAPNSRISTYDNTFQLDTSNIIMKSINIDISTTNIGNIKTGSILNLLSNSKININANQLIDITSPNSTIYSRLHITNRDVSANKYDETLVIYDISSGRYLYDVYENNNNTTGHALTLVSNNNTSNTFMNIVSPNKSGIGIGGGTYINDDTRSMGVIGLNNGEGNVFIPIQNIVSGNTKVKYYATVGINKHSPVTENYIMDVNGAMRITNGEINKVQDVSFQILNVAFSKINKLFGIAVGTPSAINIPFTQNIYYTNDGGVNWNLSLVNNEGTGLASTARNLFISVYNTEYAVIGTNNKFLLHSNNGGVNWSPINITNFNNNSSYDIKSIFIHKLSNNTFRNFLIVDNTFGYLDKDNTTTNFVPLTSLNNISDIKYVDGSSNNIYYVGIGIQIVRNISSNPTPESLSSNTNFSYNHINVLNNNAIAVGVNIISYTKNGGDSWTNITPSTQSSTSPTFNAVYVYDENIAMTVGNDGAIYYTNDGYNTWNKIPNVLLNSGGNSNILNGDNVTLRSIHIPNINSFVISKNIQNYTATSQLGLSKIYYCYFPNLFNRSQNNVVDISGCMQIGGDLNIKESGNLYVSRDSILNGNLFVNYDVSFNSRLNVGSDVTINKRLFSLDDVNFSGSLHVSKDVNIIGNLNVTSRIINNADVIMKSSLFVDIDASVNGSLNVGKDLTVNGNMYLSKNMKINTNDNITDALVNINGNIITKYIGINTSSVNTNRALDINGNVHQNNGCIFQF